MPTQRARAEWANRVRAEYRSAAVTARVLHLAIAAGLPRPLLDTAHRIVRDELDHAALSHDALRAIGGADHPIDVQFDQLSDFAHPSGPLAELVHHVLVSFCFGETLAVPLFRTMRRATTQPVARAALDRILVDEAVHRAFGWQALDTLLEVDEPGVRALIESALPDTLDHFLRAYGTVRGSVPLSADEQAAGLLSAETYRSVFHRTWTDDIRTRFHRRAVATPSLHG
ncbi:MAG: hypothetical protein CL927_04210 [Deltaproteobacteria bacterium]|nr:hypothetical protein [Deltaproteobacteria bacterium]HCH65067.1 hypothetical protein [Deltaproteobacteria bacterium]